MGTTLEELPWWLLVCLEGASQMSEEPVYEPTNREKATRAKKKGKHWCMSCDAALVGQFGKCPVCGNVSNKKKRKDKSEVG